MTSFDGMLKQKSKQERLIKEFKMKIQTFKVSNVAIEK